MKKISKYKIEYIENNLFLRKIKDKITKIKYLRVRIKISNEYKAVAANSIVNNDSSFKFILPEMKEKI